MSEFTLSSIEPTREQAKHMVSMTYIDLVTAGHRMPFTYANPENKKHIERQYVKISDHPERYIGAYKGDRITGFIKFNEWNMADQLPFESFYERAMHRLHLHRTGELPHHPIGIFALTAHPLESGGAVKASEVRTELLRSVLEGNDDREIRISHYEEDIALKATTAAGFYGTGQSGRVAGIRQSLFVRPSLADIVSQDFVSESS